MLKMKIMPKIKIKLTKKDQLFLKNLKTAFLFFNFTYLFLISIETLYKF
jgi:hypothetical protein